MKSVSTQLFEVIGSMNDEQRKKLLDVANGLVSVAEVKAPSKTESKPKTEHKYTMSDSVVGCLEFGGRQCRFVEGNFVPKPVFNGITYGLKQSGAKFDKESKAWTWATKKEAEAFKKAQIERENNR